MGKLQIFENVSFGTIHAGKGQDGKVWFVGKDVALALGYSNTKDAISRLVKPKHKKTIQRSGNTTLDFSIPNRGITIIDEAGVYALIFKSRLENAEKFQDWVYEEVLPSIREHGAYMTPDTLEQALCNPDYLLKLVTVLKEERDKRIEAEEQNKLLTADNEHKDSVINGLTEDISLAEKRQRIIQIIRHRVTPSQIATRWGLLYSEFNKKYHCNVKLRFERQREEFDPKLKNPLDYIERGMDMIPELYELACKLFESDIDSLLEEWSTTISREDFIY
ncbi:MAG TPA: hypothetical protein DCW90_05715 [Lachnospiraceae bacterium]|nr:hypothetical protein [Lachnospiraceae bacterium]